MSRFKHMPPAKPDVAGIVKEAIGEFLFRRSRQVLGADTHLSEIGVTTTGDLDDILEIASEHLGQDEEPAVLELDPDATIETVGQFIAAVEAAPPDNTKQEEQR